MQRTWRVLTALGVAGALGCSSTSGSSAGAGDAASDVAAEDAGADAGDGGTADADAGNGACNALANAAATIDVVEAVGTAPLGTGGAFVDGTYYTTAETHYRASASAPPSSITKVKETAVIANATATSADLTYVFLPNGAAAQEQRFTAKLAAHGGALVAHATCPLVIDDTTFDSYTAAATTLTLYSSTLGLAVTLTKQ